MPSSAKTLSKLDETSALYLERFRDAEATLPGSDRKWLADLRAAAANDFAQRGLPTPRIEAWKYTNLNALKKVDFSWLPEAAQVDKGSLPALVYGRESQHRLVFVNGAYRADLSDFNALPDAVEVLSFADALTSRPDLLETHLGRLGGGQPLAALNAALMRDGYVLRIPEGVTVDEPIEVLWVGTGGERPPAYHPRNLILAEAGSRATVIEHHVGLCIGGYFSNVVTEVEVGPGAILRHAKIQDESREAFHIATTNARVDADGLFDSFALLLGGKLSRNEIHVVLDAEGADCRLNGAYLMKGDQHCDTTTFIDHAKPKTTSKELYKGVLDGRARGVFQGKIIVRPGAQQSDGQQMNRALLLSPDAEIDSKPELEIYADDVKCSHGATAGEIDAEQLFYLRARGIPDTQARRLLVEAFLGEVIDGIALAGMRRPLEETVAHWMKGQATIGVGTGGSKEV
jgi:Fe-S cluster assembly protein SufD